MGIRWVWRILSVGLRSFASARTHLRKPLCMSDTIPSPSQPPPLLVGLFAAIDRMDGKAFADFFSPDAAWKFGNADPVIGREAIAATAQSVFDVLHSIKHGLRTTYQTPTGFVVEGDVTYHRKDDKRLILPFAGFFALTNGSITSYQTYMDGSPLFAGLGA